MLEHLIKENPDIITMSITLRIMELVDNLVRLERDKCTGLARL
jgi:hypothetical protein